MRNTYQAPKTQVSTDVAPSVSGQCALVLSLIKQHQPVLSLTLTADYAIPETAARVHDLRAKGYNIITRIIPQVVFRGITRRNVAAYSIGFPEWPAPSYLNDDGYASLGKGGK